MGKIPGLIFIVCVVLAIAGCGSDDSSSADPTTSSTADSASAAATNPDSRRADSTSTEATSPSSTGPDSADSGEGLTKPKVGVPTGPPPKKLQSKDIVKGTGAVAKDGDEITVRYVGVDYESGEEMEGSWDKPLSFPLGAGAAIAGWDKGLAGMREGGRRELIIPPRLAYAGERGDIAKSTLVFVVDLLAVE